MPNRPVDRPPGARAPAAGPSPAKQVVAASPSAKQPHVNVNTGAGPSGIHASGVRSAPRTPASCSQRAPRPAAASPSQQQSPASQRSNAVTPRSLALAASSGGSSSRTRIPPSPRLACACAAPAGSSSSAASPSAKRVGGGFALSPPSSAREAAPNLLRASAAASSSARFGPSSTAAPSTYASEAYQDPITRRWVFPLAAPAPAPLPTSAPSPADDGRDEPATPALGSSSRLRNAQRSPAVGAAPASAGHARERRTSRRQQAPAAAHHSAESPSPKFSSSTAVKRFEGAAVPAGFEQERVWGSEAGVEEILSSDPGPLAVALRAFVCARSAKVRRFYREFIRLVVLAHIATGEHVRLGAADVPPRGSTLHPLVSSAEGKEDWEEVELTDKKHAQEKLRELLGSLDDALRWAPLGLELLVLVRSTDPERGVERVQALYVLETHADGSAAEAVRSDAFLRDLRRGEVTSPEAYEGRPLQRRAAKELLKLQQPAVRLLLLVTAPRARSTGLLAPFEEEAEEEEASRESQATLPVSPASAGARSTACPSRAASASCRSFSSTASDDVRFRQSITSRLSAAVGNLSCGAVFADDEGAAAASPARPTGRRASGRLATRRSSAAPPARSSARSPAAPPPVARNFSAAARPKARAQASPPGPVQIQDDDDEEEEEDPPTAPGGRRASRRSSLAPPPRRSSAAGAGRGRPSGPRGLASPSWSVQAAAADSEAAGPPPAAEEPPAADGAAADAAMPEAERGRPREEAPAADGGAVQAPGAGAAFPKAEADVEMAEEPRSPATRGSRRARAMRSTIRAPERFVAGAASMYGDAGAAGGTPERRRATGKRSRADAATLPCLDVPVGKKGELAVDISRDYITMSWDSLEGSWGEVEHMAFYRLLQNAAEDEEASLIDTEHRMGVGVAMLGRACKPQVLERLGEHRKEILEPDRSQLARQKERFGSVVRRRLQWLLEAAGGRRKRGRSGGITSTPASPSRARRSRIARPSRRPTRASAQASSVSPKSILVTAATSVSPGVGRKSILKKVAFSGDEAGEAPAPSSSSAASSSGPASQAAAQQAAFVAPLPGFLPPAWFAGAVPPAFQIGWPGAIAWQLGAASAVGGSSQQPQQPLAPIPQQQQPAPAQQAQQDADPEQAAAEPRGVVISVRRRVDVDGVKPMGVRFTGDLPALLERASRHFGTKIAELWDNDGDVMMSAEELFASSLRSGFFYAVGGKGQ